ncbi:hypothetical protein DCE79_06840 [Lysinibacillus sp. 2017]|uniref:alpha/beta fold hydrolase n=1 Tax=unclassified Lysinibacillus TaxID=2636778 RepID=UPI000D527623|nr:MULTISPECIES: alpha/beta fold hydrolase [unclassified Lysinibacillus]AWE07138.1 hypothetical protein DCE79_06840 [Lysinibacillus sp. 2017]TGN36942.1 alpha/beta fold hydrolase [Lysinibacillus sp. S2017]
MKKKIFTSILASAVAIPAVVLPVNAETPFKDITSTSPYAEAVAFLQAENIIGGYDDQTFRPSETIARQHVISIINKLVDLKPVRESKSFTDIPTTHPYFDAIQKAYRAGIIDGDQNKNFNPNEAITRAQAAKILALAFDLKAGKQFPLQDVPLTHWSNEYIQRLAGNGITTITDNGLFQPNEKLTRGQYALLLYRLIHIEGEQPLTQHIGQWSGQIDIPQSPLAVQLNISENGTGTFSVPAQGVKDFPVKSVTVTGNKIRVDIEIAGSSMVIEGTVEKEKITATFTQNGMTLPLTLTPYEEPEESNVAYEELTIPVTGGQLKVALQMPTVKANAPVPVAIIIAGSGATTKDGNTVLGDNNSLKMLAEDLAAKGIASIRYDKRGVGDNMSLIAKEEDLTFNDFAKDAESIVKAVNSDARFSTVHIIGHSEGSLVGMVAATSKKVDSIVSIAGAGRPIEEVLVEQLTAQLPEDLLKKSKDILASLKKGELVADVPESLYSVFRPSVQPYMISWLQYDPAEVLKKLDVPTLIVQGKNDLQVKMTDSQRLSTAKPTAKIVYFDKMNHVLKDSPTDQAGNVATYTDPSLPLAEGLVDSITTFIYTALK